ncbi:right-handed parallel beta-helix repeat-containing protein [Burkholderia vietnamiensis]|uniref:right-handed parallel beta-helix repeat-containing protein n=1 Tax=Burkholderia vietnamiensis TaxID=60552 RepID=UPI0009BE723C|nr:right-handed parallel beta-helix repeat-containing protein [Burkholderia vietnamiensis]MDN8044769.1 right-handed parallel beta-helix repeat-containing protein [Burkholderia vietnamiensis]HDR9030070.1 right-handed parallel beta-helix repeat-containing protein [Burkholderia vietnamiensis]HDR9131590.1 right-handed parallel beta-helix repeat-containing protein [Burkholderia vietnamiensis]
MKFDVWKLGSRWQCVYGLFYLMGLLKFVIWTMNSTSNAYPTVSARRRSFVISFSKTVFIGICLPFRARAAVDGDGSNFLVNLLERAKDGANIVIPAGRYILSKPLSLKGRGITISGSGNVDLFTIEPNGTVFLIRNSEDIVVDGINILAAYQCRAGVLLERCSNVKLSNMTVKNFSEAGVEVKRSSNCAIEKLKFYDAVPDYRWMDTISSDIFINGTNSNIVVSNCLHGSGGGYGIQVRTNQSGERSVGHVISGNNISGYNSYGIMLYRNGPYYAGDDQTVSNIVLRHNVIRSISGRRPADASKPDRRDFGAGIYLQGAESCLVEDNIIDNTNISTNSELLAPGAIGIANAGAAVVRGNVIYNCLYGIYINDSLGKGSRKGVIDILRNNFRSVKRLCIKVVAKDNVNISGSVYDGRSDSFMKKFGGHENFIMNHIKQSDNKRFD